MNREQQIISYKANIKALHDIYRVHLAKKQEELRVMFDALPHRDSHDTAQDIPDDAA